MKDINYLACRKCTPFGGKYVVSTVDGEEVAVKCECYKTFLKNKRLSIGMLHSGISDFIYDYSIDMYVGVDINKNLAKIEKFITEFDTKYYNKHLYFYGDNACQKTTLMSYIGRELLKKNKKVMFIIMNDLVNYLKNLDFLKDNNDKNSLQVYLNDLMNCDLLLIDDAFDNKKTLTYSTDYLKSFIDTFLRKRLEVISKSTIVTSNIVIEDISEKDYSVSIKSLVERNFHTLEFLDKYCNVDVESFWD